MRWDQNCGTKSLSFQIFNQKVKGIRRGELTVLTGPTGSGKTTFLSQLSLDFAKQGIGTLWGSFEIKNDILISNMLQQFAGENLVKKPELFRYHSEQFQKLPLHFLSFYGESDIDRVCHTIEWAVYELGVMHVIIDNLQFLMGVQAKGVSVFQAQDEILAKFRSLVTKHQIHLSLVIHPKKVPESDDLDISSIFGTAKATQEADNIFIIQTRNNFRIIDIKKNRFDGDIGKSAIIFDRSTKRFEEITKFEASDLVLGKVNISELLDLKKKQRS